MAMAAELFAINREEIGRIREGALYKYHGTGKVRMLGYSVDDRTGLEMVMYQAPNAHTSSGPLDGRVHLTTPDRFVQAFKPSMDPGDGWVDSNGRALEGVEETPSTRTSTTYNGESQTVRMGGIRRAMGE